MLEMFESTDKVLKEKEQKVNEQGMEDLALDYTGEELRVDDTVRLSPASKSYQEFKDHLFTVTAIEREGDVWRAYLRSIDDPEFEMNEFVHLVEKE